MNNSPWWDMFESYGMVEMYLLYKMIENQERENAGSEDGGIDTYRSKFE